MPGLVWMMIGEPRGGDGRGVEVEGAVIVLPGGHGRGDVGLGEEI